MAEYVRQEGRAYWLVEDSTGDSTYLIADTVVLRVTSAGAVTATAGLTGTTATFTGALTASGGGALTGTWTDLGTVTTMDLNGGTIDGTVIGGASAAAATVTALTVSTSATFAGATVADGGAVTTVDINGGTIDGTTIGASAAAAATVAALVATSLDLNGAADVDVAGNTATLTNTSDAAAVQVAVFEGNRATPADGDAAYVSLQLSDSAGNQDESARLTWQATTVLDGATQDSDLILAATNNGSLNSMVTLDGSANQVVLNVGSTFAGTTIADLGTVTTANIDGGSLDGVTIGAAAAAAATVTTLAGSAASNVATFTNTNDGASSQVAVLQGDRATPADNDAAYVSLSLSDSAGNQDESARITWQATTVLDGATQDSDLILAATNNGSLNSMITLDGSVNQVVLNVGSTFAGTTIADLGTVTTANIDGGTIDGTTVGAGTPSSGAFTTLSTTGATTTTVGVGAAGADGTVTSEAGVGGIHLSTVTYTKDLVVSGAVSLAGGATVYTFPAKRVVLISVSTDATLTSTGAGGCIGDTPDVGVGTGLASGAVATLDLAGAGAEDLIAGATLDALAAAPGTDLNQILPVAIAGTPLAASATLYANFADAWAGADTVNIAGTLKIAWMELD